MTKNEIVECRAIRKPRWKEYTLIRYDGKKEISKEKIWIDESQIFPSEEDFLWERDTDKNEEIV